MPILAPRPQPDFAGVAGVILSLPQRMADIRTAHPDLTLKAQAAAVGVGAATLGRFVPGSQPTQATVLSVLAYLERA